jgi:hypothetical protein
MLKNAPNTGQSVSGGNKDRDVDPELIRPVTINKTLLSRRVYYPLKHHQREFDELEGSHSELIYQPSFATAFNAYRTQMEGYHN